MEVVGVAGSFVPFDLIFSEMKSTGFDGFSSYMVAVVVTGVLSPVVDKLISVVHSVSRVSLLVMSPVWLKLNLLHILWKLLVLLVHLYLLTQCFLK